jgi:DNA-binding XRE family transcriptional regulator
VQKFLQTRTDLEISQAQIRRKFKIAETSIQGYENGTVFKPKWDPDVVMRWMNAKSEGVVDGLQSPGQRFAELRHSKKQTQVQVAERFGVSKTAITDFERGEILWPQWDVAAVREWLESL